MKDNLVFCKSGFTDEAVARRVELLLSETYEDGNSTADSQTKAIRRDLTSLFGRFCVSDNARKIEDAVWQYRHSKGEVIS